MFKKSNLLLFLICLAGVVILAATPDAKIVETDHAPFSFKYLIGEIVEFDGDWWEITARQEKRSSINGKIYPWYLLVRPIDGKIEQRWVWACAVDHYNPAGRSKECTEPDCDDAPPPCPKPPC